MKEIMAGASLKGNGVVCLGMCVHQMQVIDGGCLNWEVLGLSCGKLVRTDAIT